MAHVQWSKLRARLLDLLAPSMRGRVEYRLTKYRPGRHFGPRFWITLDGNEVFTAHNFWSEIEGNPFWTLSEENRCGDADYVFSTVRLYLDMDPHIALESTDPILRALAVVDRRIGMRTLAKLDLVNYDHPLVRVLHNARMRGSVKQSPPTAAARDI